MREYLVTLLIAAALSYLITPAVSKIAIKFGAVAVPRIRDIHHEPIPRWGGVAMWAAMSLTFAIVNHLSLVGKAFGHEAQGIFLAGTLLVILGMLDDRYQLDSLTKLAGQAMAAGILLLYGVQLFWLPINGVIAIPPSIGQLVTVLIVLVIINAVNFIDGMDGLAAGIVAIAGAAFFAFAYELSVVYGFNRAGAPSLITAVTIGVCLGFLPHNAHPARIFMGDSGSMLLGLMLAAAAITLTGQVDPNAISAEKLGPTLLPLLLPFAVLAIPVADLLLAIVRRTKAGKSPFAPDKEHLHHRLMNWGNSQLRTTLLMYLWTAALAFPMSISAFVDLPIAIVIAALLIAIAVFFTLKSKDRNTVGRNPSTKEHSLKSER